MVARLRAQVIEQESKLSILESEKLSADSQSTSLRLEAQNMRIDLDVARAKASALLEENAVLRAEAQALRKALDEAGYMLPSEVIIIIIPPRLPDAFVWN